jgi:hypothetical protein
MQEFEVGDRVFLNLIESPSHGRPGIIKAKTIFQCGNLHYLISWENGGEIWLHWSMVQNENS